VLLAATATVWGQSSLEVDPQFTVLGDFSGVNPGANVFITGATTLRIQSTDPWSVYATLLEAPRRIPDNLELPLDRARQVFPERLIALCQFEPVMLDYGPGQTGRQTVSYEWQTVQYHLSQIVGPTEPPGRYQFRIRLELRDREGHGAIADPVTLSLEFRILPFVEVSLSAAQVNVDVADWLQSSESDPFFVTVRSNSTWALEVNCVGPLVNGAAGPQIGLNHVMWMVESGDDWDSQIPSFQPVSATGVIVATGHEPAPFSVTEARVPIVLRVETDSAVLTGTYGADLHFTVHTDFSAR
jgi:hypothetical protein